ncbi:hypothetical protein [Paenibacillus sp. TSA_86.1]|uniref:hypothetical protein n=1 Tax=Paenibacillus sp. TSA_86.1 TaxID=3415649 RepID=UPI004045E8BD
MKEEEVLRSLSGQVSGAVISDEIAFALQSSSETAVASGNALESKSSSTLGSEIGFKPSPKSEPKPGSKAKLVAFSLMLAVPAVLTGCGSSNDECDPQYDTGCEYDSSSGHYYYGGYGGSSYRGSKDSSSSYKSSSKSKSSGFGSFFRSSGG